MERRIGVEVISDVHLGDFGLQMGLIIEELKDTDPTLVYFDKNFTGKYPDEAPFCAGELEEIYPRASKRSKEDEDFKRRALKATSDLQGGDRGYNALLSHILNVSISDMKENYERLDVSFDLWLGESDAQKYVPDMIDGFVRDGFAHESEGALVIDVSRETDSKEIPPCIVRKSDGASLYATTDLATLVQRIGDYSPDEVLYIVDKRQSLHFTQVFRAAKKTGIVPEGTALTFLGFGTMNGRDKKPFKTRQGGVMRLKDLIDDIEDVMYEKIIENKKEKNEKIDEQRERTTAKTVALSALKYADLSNQAQKDYVFDIDRFTSFEGNTGPYILYTMVRIKSILRKSQTGEKDPEGKIAYNGNEGERELLLKIAQYPNEAGEAAKEKAPHKLCAYIYELCDAFNHFYHETKILADGDEERKKSNLSLINTVLRVLEDGIFMLGFSAPDSM